MTPSDLLRKDAPGLADLRGRLRPLPLAGSSFLIVLLVLFLIVPIGLAIAQAFTFAGRPSLEWMRRVVTNRILLRELANGLVLASCTTILSMVIAIPLAMLRAKCSFRGQGFLSLAVLVPLILPPFVGALSMKGLLAQYGVLNRILDKLGLVQLYGASPPPDWLESGFWGTVILQSLHLFPILYLNASAALANIDPAYSQAARNLGASPLRTFFRITLPLMRPGLFAGGTIVFIWAFTDLGTPLIMGYEALTPVRLFKELAGADMSPRTFSLVFIMLSSAVGLYIVGKFLFGRSAAAESSKATVAAQSRTLGAGATLAAWALFGTVTLLALVPHIGVVLNAVSGEWSGTILPSKYTLQYLRDTLTSDETHQSIVNSLRYAGLATAVDLLMGAAAAWLIVRSRIPGRNTLDGLTMLPLAVPGLILAAGYVALTAPGTWLQSIGPARDPLVIIVIAYSVRRLPFAVRSISAGLEQVPTSLEEAARNLGASKFMAVARITAPLVLANIVAAAVLTFSFAVLEVSDSLILAQVSDDYPITKQIYILATSGNREAVNMASALGVYGMVLLGGTMALASALLGKKLGAIFRA
ncbi:MAG: ABC transporter permease [Phycisphaerae bacterium]